MGMCPISKDDTGTTYTTQEQEQQSDFMQKVRLLQQEMSMILQQREEERKGYERSAAVFARREAKWKEERKKLREEVRRLRRCLKEREGEGEGVDGDGVKGTDDEGKMMLEVSNLVVEQMREERARRDEAVEKWKMLYLAIKNELDDLIERTHQGRLICWRGAEEDLTEALKRELNAKEEKIQALKAQIAAMEQEEYKRKREFDILRQSLRIVTNKKKAMASLSDGY